MNSNGEKAQMNGKPRTMELENQAVKTKKPFYKRQSFVVASIIGTIMNIIIIVMTFTVFKSTNPKIRLTSATVSGLSPRVIAPDTRIELNMTIDLQLQVRNKNYFSFKYGEGESLAFYQGIQVGKGAITAGKIGSRSSTTIAARLTTRQSALVNMTRLAADINNDMLGFEMRTSIAGQVKILGIIKKSVTGRSTCQLDIRPSTLEVLRLEC